MVGYGRALHRENEILKTIRAFADAGLNFIVVGGYAVSGLGRHRFSVELDVIVDEKDLDTFTKILKESVFEQHAEGAGFDEAN
ncbi:MAG TPA: hypothetical protein ENG65_05820, partial [Candidatus Bathyarchaeota archaeon]|nr:hypothetical protein [Candidatus Bathyarchaeota archaeon]